MLKKTLILLVAVSCGLVSCSSAETEDDRYYNSWSSDEIENSQHFLKATAARSEATRISNSSELGRPTKSEFALMKRHMRTAFQEATKVRDEILDKIHPELKDHFRNEFQKGLQLRLSYLERETKDRSFEIYGSVLHDRWIDWQNAHSTEIRILRPK